MNRSILLSILSIFVVAGLVGAGAVAYFSDIGTSSNNVFAAGTLNLQLDDINETVTENVTASLGGNNFFPGSSTTGFISMHNGGAVDMAEIKLGANETANNNAGGDGSDLASVLDLTVLIGNNSDCSAGTVDHTSAINAALGGGTSLTLAELNATDYDSLPGLSVGSDRFLCVTFTMQSTAGNEYQGDSITEDFVFEGHQNVIQ